MTETDGGRSATVVVNVPGSAILPQIQKALGDGEDEDDEGCGEDGGRDEWQRDAP